MNFNRENFSANLFHFVPLVAAIWSCLKCSANDFEQRKKKHRENKIEQNSREMLKEKAVGYSLKSLLINVLFPELKTKHKEEFTRVSRQKICSNPLGPDKTTTRAFFLFSVVAIDQTVGFPFQETETMNWKSATLKEKEKVKERRKKNFLVERFELKWKVTGFFRRKVKEKNFYSNHQKKDSRRLTGRILNSRNRTETLFSRSSPSFWKRQITNKPAGKLHESIQFSK